MESRPVLTFKVSTSAVSVSNVITFVCINVSTTVFNMLFLYSNIQTPKRPFDTRYFTICSEHL
uniref:Uncharacterized protein n=1 Tax=Anguilla anguilla TaxID=7936 RepID=A0A0E9UAT2_ANGAN